MNFIDRLQALGEGVMIAFDAIRQNKVRAALTILGIAVGVFVVTAMSAAVRGRVPEAYGRPGKVVCVTALRQCARGPRLHAGAYALIRTTLV